MNGPYPANELLVADSLLVDDGLVLAAPLHRQRFVDSVLVQAPALVDAAGPFWDDSLRSVPLDGAWFPRVTLTAGSNPSGPAGSPAPILGFELRPAPPRSHSAVLVTAAVDPRVQPLIKGPDLARLGALRAAAERAGADEAVLLSPDGLVVEGNYSSIVWWRGDALCVVDESLPRLPGITEASLVTLATALGVTVHRELVEPDDLDGHEVWTLSSLHGLRLVREWKDGPSVAQQPGRLRLWRARLDALRRRAA